MKNLFATALLSFLALNCTKKNNSVDTESFKVALASEPLDWNWVTARDLTSLGILDNLVKPLVKIKYTTNQRALLKPGLLTNWRQDTSNNKVWLFKLNQNSKWSDGSKVTLKQIHSHLSKLIEKKNSPLCRFEAGQIASVRIEQKSQSLQIETKQQLPTLPNILSLLCFSPHKKHPPKSWKFIGTGDYTVTSYFPGKKMTLRRVRESKMIKRVEIFFLPSWETAISLFETGDLDFVPVVPTEQIPNIKKTKFLLSKPSFTTSFLVLNPNKKPFKNLILRKSIQQALDNEDLSKVMTGYKKSNSWLPHVFGNSVAPLVLEKKATFKAVVTPPLKIDFPIVDQSNYRRLAERLQIIFRPFGILLQIRMMDWSSYLIEINNKEPLLFMRSWTSHWGHPVEFLNIFSSDSNFNSIKWQYKKYDENTKSSWKEDSFSPESFTQRAAREISLDKALVIPLLEHKQHYLISTKYSSFESSPLLKFDFSTIRPK